MLQAPSLEEIDKAVGDLNQVINNAASSAFKKGSIKWKTRKKVLPKFFDQDCLNSIKELKKWGVNCHELHKMQNPGNFPIRRKNSVRNS